MISSMADWEYEPGNLTLSSRSLYRRAGYLESFTRDDTLPITELTLSELEELKALRKLQIQLEQNYEKRDLQYGDVNLVPYAKRTEYVKEYYAELNNFNPDDMPYCYINWRLVADDYFSSITEVDYADIKYYTIGPNER